MGFEKLCKTDVNYVKLVLLFAQITRVIGTLYIFFIYVLLRRSKQGNQLFLLLIIVLREVTILKSFSYIFVNL